MLTNETISSIALQRVFIFLNSKDKLALRSVSKNLNKEIQEDPCAMRSIIKSKMLHELTKDLKKITAKSDTESSDTYLDIITLMSIKIPEYDSILEKLFKEETIKAILDELISLEETLDYLKTYSSYTLITRIELLIKLK